MMICAAAWAVGPTNNPVAGTLSVVTDSAGNLVSPTNFWAQNASNINAVVTAGTATNVAGTNITGSIKTNNLPPSVVVGLSSTSADIVVTPTTNANGQSFTVAPSGFAFGSTNGNFVAENIAGNTATVTIRGDTGGGRTGVVSVNPGTFQWGYPGVLLSEDSSGALIANAATFNGNVTSTSGGKFIGDGSGLTNLANGSLPALTPAQIIVGSASSNAVAVTVSGDDTISSGGVVTHVNTAAARAHMGVPGITDTNHFTGTNTFDLLFNSGGQIPEFLNGSGTPVGSVVGSTGWVYLDTANTNFYIYNGSPGGTASWWRYMRTNDTGAGLTALNATQLTSGTVPNAAFPATLPAVGGVNLTGLNATQLTSGTIPSGVFPNPLPVLSGANLTSLNGSSVASGTVADARLSPNVSLLNTAQTNTASSNVYTGPVYYQGGAFYTGSSLSVAGPTTTSNLTVSNLFVQLLAGATNPIAAYASNSVTGYHTDWSSNASMDSHGLNMHFGVNTTNAANTNVFSVGYGSTAGTNTNSDFVAVSSIMTSNNAVASLTVGVTLVNKTNEVFVGVPGASIEMTNTSVKVTGTQTNTGSLGVAGTVTGSFTGNASGLTNLDPGVTRVSDFSAAADPVDAALHQWTNRLGTVYFPNTPANNFTGFTLTAPFTAGFNVLVSTLDIEGQNNGSSVWNWTGTNGVMLKYGGPNNNTPVNLNNITLNGSGGTGTNFGAIQTSITQGGLGPINWNNVTLNSLNVGAQIFNSGGFFYGENQWNCGIGMFFPTLSDNQVIDIRSIGSTNVGVVMEGKGNRVNYNGSGEQIGILIGKGGNADLQVSAESPSNCVVGIGYPPGSTIFPKQTLATSAGHIDGITIRDGYVFGLAATNAASDNWAAGVKLWDEPDSLHLVDMSFTGINAIVSRTNIADNTPMQFDGVTTPGAGGSNAVTFSDGTFIQALSANNHVGINVGDLEYTLAALKYQRDTSGNIWTLGNFSTQKPFTGVNGDNAFASSNTISFRAGADNGLTVVSNGGVVLAEIGTRGHPSIVTQSGTGTDLWYPTSTGDIGGDDIANWNNDGNNVWTVHGRFGTYPTNYAGNKTLGILDSTVIVKASGVAVITLPSAASNAKGAQYQILNDGTTNMTLNTTSSQTIGNNITLTSMTLGPGQFMHVQGDTANWKEIGGNISTGGFTTINTNQFAVSSTGWTNSNAFDCVMYITGATAATFTYSDGTNTIFTDTGLTFTTAETLIMHPSYKVVVSSGTITGIAIVK